MLLKSRSRMNAATYAAHRVLTLCWKLHSAAAAFNSGSLDGILQGVIGCVVLDNNGMPLRTTCDVCAASSPFTLLLFSPVKLIMHIRSSQPSMSKVLQLTCGSSADIGVIGLQTEQS